MWMSSKEAAEFLRLNKKSLEKSCFRANQSGKKICSISGQYLPFEYIPGVGFGGKTLQIFVEMLNQVQHDGLVVQGDGLQVQNENKSSSCGGGGETVAYSLNCNAAPTRRAYDNENLEGAENEDLQRRVREKNECGEDSKVSVLGARQADNGEISNQPKNARERLPLGYTSTGAIKAGDKAEVVGYAKAHSVRAAAEFYGVSEKNIYRWQKLYAKSGVRALADKRGSQNQKVDMEMVANAIYAVGTAHTSTYHMAYCMFLAKKNKKPFDMFDLKSDISKASFYRAVERLKKEDADIRNYLKRGYDGLDVRPTAIRDYLEPNAEWQIDATRIDFMALNAFGEPTRYTAVAIIDVASRRRVWELFDSANSYANVRLLKKAFLRLGVPEVIKGDNGKDYLSEHFQGVLKRIGVPYWAAEPFKGWQKGGIERNFGVLQNKLEILPGYIGHNAGQRIEREAQAIEKSKRMSGVKTHLNGLLTKAELQAFIDEANERIFNKGFDAPECNIDFRLFGQAKKVVLHATGVNFNSAKYVNLDIFDSTKINTKIEIIEDIDNFSKVYAYSLDGAFICEMMDAKVAELTAEEVKAKQRKYKKDYVTPKKAIVRELQKTKNEEFKAIGQQFNSQRDAEYKKAKDELLKKPKDEEEITIKSEITVTKANVRHYMPSLAELEAALSD